MKRHADRSGAGAGTLAPDALAPALLDRMVGFCRLARAQGHTLGLDESEDACRVAGLFLGRDAAAFREGLRSLLCQSPEQVHRFDALFERYWSPGGGPDPDHGTAGRDYVRTDPVAGAAGWQVAGWRDSDGAQAEEEGHSEQGASAAAVLRRTDFSLVPHEDVAALERLSLRLWQRLSLRLKRRLRGPVEPRAVDLRRTMRRSVGRGGELMELVRRGRRRRKPRLVMLLDVSGSMSVYSFFLLRLLYTLQRRFKRVASFVFSTGLLDVTPLLAEDTLQPALEAMSAVSFGWGGGTRIGECLARLEREHGDRVMGRDTLLVILSDGWDVGEPEALRQALQRIRLRARRVVWLNPLLGLAGYEPRTKGMAAALPYLDVFAPAHNLDSLMALEHHLAGVR